MNTVNQMFNGAVAEPGAVKFTHNVATPASAHTETVYSVKPRSAKVTTNTIAAEATQMYVAPVDYMKQEPEISITKAAVGYAPKENSDIPNGVFDIEYRTQWKDEVDFLAKRGIYYTFKKVDPEYDVATYKYTKTADLFIALADFYLRRKRNVRSQAKFKGFRKDRDGQHSQRYEQPSFLNKSGELNPQYVIGGLSVNNHADKTARMIEDRDAKPRVKNNSQHAKQDEKAQKYNTLTEKKTLRRQNRHNDQFYISTTPAYVRVTPDMRAGSNLATLTTDNTSYTAEAASKEVAIGKENVSVPVSLTVNPEKLEQAKQALEEVRVQYESALRDAVQRGVVNNKIAGNDTDGDDAAVNVPDDTE